MKDKIIKGVRGSISVILVIILTPMLTLAAVVVDTARLNMARSMISSAGDLTMNTALANYDTILKDVYGLFAMSQDEIENSNPEELKKTWEDNIKRYFQETLTGYGVVSARESGDYVNKLMGEFSTLFTDLDEDQVSNASNFLKMEFDPNFKIEKAEGSQLSNSSVMRKQIVDYMKYRAPINVGMSFIDSISSFNAVEKQTEVVNKQVETQEKTQEVANCQHKLINSIRLFDKIITFLGGPGISGWNNPILSDDEKKGKTIKQLSTGKDGKGDNQNQWVPVYEYPEQLLKYKEGWGGVNYKHINKIELIFLLKSPGLETRRLYEGYYSEAADIMTYFINGSAEEAKLNIQPALSKHFIKHNIPEATTFEEAKTAYETKRDEMKTTVYQNAKKYEDANFLPSSNLSADGRSFADENAAINSFIAYENFLLNKGDLQYEKFIYLLDHLYFFEKYYNQLKKFYEKRIEEIEVKIKNKEKEIKTLNDTSIEPRETLIERINTNLVPTCNKQNKIFLGKADGAVNNLRGKATQGEDGKYHFAELESEKIKQIAEGLMNSSRTYASNPSNNYSTDMNFLYRIKDEGNYINEKAEAVKKIEKIKVEVNQNDNTVTLNLKCDPEMDLEYFDRIANSNPLKKYTNDPEFNAANAIYKVSYCLTLARRYTEAITALGNIKSAKENDLKNIFYPKRNALTKELEELKSQKKALEGEKDNLKKEYSNLVYLRFKPIIDRYQNDLISYLNYKITAENVIESEASAINEQFNDILKNVEVQKNQLEKISNELDDVKEAANEYINYTGYWAAVNEEYARTNGKDEFYAENAADIEQMKNEYDIEAIEQMIKYTNDVKELYNDFFNYINSKSNFKYLDSNVKNIKGYKEVASANNKRKSEVSEQIVTAADVDKYFRYSNDEAFNMEYTSTFYGNQQPQKENGGNGWRFLTPKVQSKTAEPYLVSLDKTFPEAGSSTVVVSETGNDSKNGETEEVSSDEAKSNYKKLKNTLKDGGPNESEAKGKDNWGYKYEGVSFEGTTDTETREKWKLKTSGDEVEDDVNASESVGDQKSGIGNILDGIGNIAQTGLENAYILDYIFENFSYNTMVQDKVAEIMIKNGDLNKDDAGLKQLIDGSTKVPKKYSDLLKGEGTNPPMTCFAQTQSRYDINAAHNKAYGAEIEYMLYGFEDATSNVTAAKASIYALRFGFDCIYAFTNTEIRNMARSVGMAVQTATLGVVPYLLVMVIMQLAIAAAEAALDLTVMSNGLDVVLIKSKETWMLSLSGGVDALKSVAIQNATEAAKDVVDKGINKVTSGIQKLVDAGADEIEEAKNEVIADLGAAAEQQIRDVVDQASTIVISEVNKGLNNLMYDKYDEFITNGAVDTQLLVNDAFEKVHETINGLDSQFAGNAVADKILNKVKSGLNGAVEKLESEIKNEISNVKDSADVRGKIASKINEFTQTINNEVSRIVDGLEGDIKSIAGDAISDVSTQINNAIAQAGDKASEAVKNSIQNAANGFLDTLNKNSKGKSSIGGGIEGTKSTTNKSLASTIKFGYKEYLMLFVFIKLCSNDGQVLERLSRVVELNVHEYKLEYLNAKADKTGDKTWLDKMINKINSQKYSLKKAYTYVNIHGDIKLNMLFLDLGFFQRMVKDDNGVDDDTASSFAIKYNGLMGY